MSIVETGMNDLENLTSDREYWPKAWLTWPYFRIATACFRSHSIVPFDKEYRCTGSGSKLTADRQSNHSPSYYLNPKYSAQNMEQLHSPTACVKSAFALGDAENHLRDGMI